MKDDFEVSFDFVIGAEGVYSDDPRDSGGPTKFGISQKAYPNLTIEQIKSLKISDAKKIYFEDYWIASQCDKLWWPYNIAVFDFAVNCGVMLAKKMLQKAINVETDGKLGPITIKALGADFNALDKYFEMRRGYYRTLCDLNAKNKVFLKGWLNRVNRLEKYIKGATS